MKKKIIISVSVLIVIALSASVFFVYKHTKNKDAVNTTQKATPIPVRVMRPLVRTIPITVSATGTLVAPKDIMITPRASGYVRGIRFHEGEAVPAGKILFKLNDQTQKNALIAASAADRLSKFEFKEDRVFLRKGFITRDQYFDAQMLMKKNQAAFATATTNLDNRAIKTPFAGTTGSIKTNLGAYITPGQALTSLVDNAVLRAEYRVPVQYLTQLKLNQPVTINSTVAKNKTHGLTSYISPTVNQATQMISVHADIKNTRGNFKAGETVKITQKLGVQKNRLLIPAGSVFATLSKYYVFIVKKNKAVKVFVTVEEHVQGNAVIGSGLNKTDQVIVTGEHEVHDKQLVHVSQS